MDCILEKISFLLPQDIILLMHYSDKKNKYKNEYRKIINYYKDQQHTNLVNFIQSMENNKNIIYTFSYILDTLIFNFEDDDKSIETVKFGQIKKENIFILLINGIKSENELENIFDNIYSEEKIKLIIFKFNSNEVELINYMKNFIEEKENLNAYKSKKSFIFIVYIKREFFQEIEASQNHKNNNWNQNISHISEYHQIFIDNLNGNEQNIAQLIGQKDIKNIMNICVDTNKLLNQNIYNILSYFSYNFKYQLKDIKINNKNYTK